MVAVNNDAPAQIDYAAFNEQGQLQYAGGSIFERFIKGGGDIGYFRPMASDDPDDHRNFMTVNRLNKKLGKYEPKVLVTNTPAALRFQDWRLIDEAIIRIAKPRLRIIGDLRGAGLETSLANGMGFTVFSYENQSDISTAQISMDGMVQSEGDRPVFDIVNLPLPIIHKDFHFSARQVMASRNGYSPLDLTTAELAARRVAEMAEQLVLGVQTSYTYGGGTIYGFTNHPSRLTKTMTAPTAAGWTPQLAVQEVLAMINQSIAAYHYGPWKLYLSVNWLQYLDEDYSSAKGDNTLRQRLMAIPNITGVETVDYLQFLANQPYTCLMVQQTSDTVRMVIGMDIVTLQWESHGGMQMNFKVMCIMVPQLRADQNGNMGIVHGSASSGGSTLALP